MNEKEDFLNKAIGAVKNENIPNGPTQELSEITLEKLNEISKQLPDENIDKQVVLSKRFTMINNLMRIAAVIILSIIIGYAAGRISSSKTQNQIESNIRAKLLEEVTQYVQESLVSNYVQIRQELTEQYKEELNIAAIEILNTSNNTTNHLIEELIQTVAAAQIQDRQWITTALRQNEINRLQDKSQLGSALINFASFTEQNLQQTQDDVAIIANYLTDTNIDNTNTDEYEN